MGTGRDAWRLGFAISLTGLDMIDRRNNVACRLEYWGNGVWVTLFEHLMSCDRAGSEPDRFLREMRDTERSDPEEARKRFRKLSNPTR